MTVRTRRILFVISLALFAIITPVLIEYSRGMRFDFKTWQFMETGGFFFRILSPTETEIYLDNKKIKTTSSLSYFNNAFIQNLTPGDYAVRISKDGYQDWIKTLRIDPQLVTEAQNILLMPKSLKIKPFFEEADKIIGAHYSNSKKGVVVLRQQDGKGSILNIVELGGRKENPIIITNKENELVLVDWQENENKFIFKNPKDNPKEKDVYFLYNFPNTTLTNLNNILPVQFPVGDIKDIKIGPQEYIFILKNNTLYSFNIKYGALYLLKKDVISIESQGDTLYIVSQDESGNILLEQAQFKENILSPAQTIGVISQFIQEGVYENASFKISVISGDNIFIHEKTNGDLLEFRNNTLIKIDRGIRVFEMSADENKIAYIKESKLMVYYRNDIKNQPYKQSGNKEAIFESADLIDSVSWFDDDAHIIFGLKDGLRIAELDGRDARNIHKITDSYSDKFFYDRALANIYFLKDQALYEIPLKN